MSNIADSFKKMLFNELGKPYIYGANGPNEFDCSGLVLWYLKNAGILPRKIDLSAESLYMYLVNNHLAIQYDSHQHVKLGDIIFYKNIVGVIDHVGIATDEMFVINAAGGDSTTTTLDAAIKKQACVRLNLFDYRPIYSIVSPKYRFLI